MTALRTNNLDAVFARKVERIELMTDTILEKIKQALSFEDLDSLFDDQILQFANEAWINIVAQGSEYLEITADTKISDLNLPYPWLNHMAYHYIRNWVSIAISPDDYNGQRKATSDMANTILNNDLWVIKRQLKISGGE